MWFERRCKHQWVEYARAEHPPATRPGDCVYLHEAPLRLAFLVGQVVILFRCTHCTETRMDCIAGKLLPAPTTLNPSPPPFDAVLAAAQASLTHVGTGELRSPGIVREGGRSYEAGGKLDKPA